MNRRAFVKNTGSAALALSATPLVGQKTTRKYKTALIGSGWWGMNICRFAIASGECTIVALADVDRNQLDPAAAEVEKLSGDKPRKYKNYRELLAMESPEIVIVGTPDHWHALTAIAAMEAGAHVYVEKPISHTIMEGRAMVNAARKHERVVQVGTHRRVSPHNVSGMEFLKSGKAGKIGMVRAFVHYPGNEGQYVPDSDPPVGLDWDFWCGPAPLRPYNETIHPKGFRQFLDYANGTLGDWGIHWLDQILWWTDELYPKSVYSTGGRPIRRDNTTSPDTQIATYEFESFSVSWEHRRYAGNTAEKRNLGCYFYGTEGTFHMGWRNGWTFYPDNDRKPVLHEDPKLEEPDSQNIRGLWTNFMECIKTGERPVCDIEIGHRSTNMALLGMLSLKLGRSVRWDGEKEKILDDKDANKLLKRDYRKPWKYPKV